jgi:nitrogen regulatory protein PII
MFKVVGEDDQVEPVITSIQEFRSIASADDRVFITDVMSAYTLRAGESGLLRSSM